MCGICGLVSADPQHHVAIDAINTAIAHRGPDGSGTWQGANASLGHRRLAIIDLVTGDQPLGSPDGTLQLVFNGEIYNFQALRAELRVLGHTFRTTSDTEVIVHALQQWGDQALARLDGMFALAAWDSREQRLLLARDRLGKKPLYYAPLPGGGLSFASEIKALLQHPAVERTLAPDALGQFLCYGYVPPPATWFQQIKQLQPGHALAWQAGAVHQWRWWSAHASAQAPRLELSSTAAALELRRRIRAAVERRLISDVPLGAFLSGGIDSSVVVAEMQDLLDQPVKTFSIGFHGGGWYDETAYAREVAAHLGTEHHEFQVEPDAHQLLAVLLHHYDEPFADSSALPTYLLSAMTKQHVSVALAGDGGDEIFAGYERFGAALWATRYQRLPAPMRRAIERSAAWLPAHQASAPTARLQRVLQKLALPLEVGFPRWLMLWTPEEIADLTGAAPEPTVRYRAHTAGIAHPLAATMTYNLTTYLPDDLLVKVDRMSMAHGLEVRAPLLDTALVEWALRLPPQLQWRGRRGKWLLRQAYRERLPATVLSRPKHGFGVPLDAWFRGPLRAWLSDTLLAASPAYTRWLDRNTIAALCADHWSARRNAGHQLWALLALELWLQHINQSSEVTI